jgi:hypothetical protein
MVHGGPVPREREVRPPQWPAFRGYGALLAQAGFVCGMFEYGFVDDESFGVAGEHSRCRRDAAQGSSKQQRVSSWK